jgi:hypothetical protein
MDDQLSLAMSQDQAGPSLIDREFGHHRIIKLRLRMSFDWLFGTISATWLIHAA